jgi:hypothetical protein
MAVTQQRCMADPGAGPLALLLQASDILPMWLCAGLDGARYGCLGTLWGWLLASRALFDCCLAGNAGLTADCACE